MDFSKFTDNTKSTIQQAWAFAKNCSYAHIDCTIMMVAMLKKNPEMVEFVFSKLGVSKMDFSSKLAPYVSQLPKLTGSQIGFAPDLNAAFEAASRFAEQSRGSVVAPEHILYGMAEGTNNVSRTLQQFGVTPDALRRAVLSFRNEDAPADEGSVDESNIPTLKKFAKNLVVSAEKKEIEPVIGRDDEIRRILQILSRKTKNNPVLIGSPGTGKTAIVEGLAHRIVRGDVPEEIKKMRLYSLDLTALSAGASAQGEYEERLKNLINEVTENPDIVLFVDEVHLLIGAGGSGAMDAANILKPEMARGKLKIIAATTPDEYKKYIEKDKAFERRLQKVTVEEPDEESAISIMRGIKSRFEAYHSIKILDSAIVSAVRLSSRYITDRFLPDKAIDLLDEAASQMKIERSSVPDELDEIARAIRQKELELESVRKEVGSAEVAEALTLEIQNMREKENQMTARWHNERAQLAKVLQMTAALEQLVEDIDHAERERRYEEVLQLKQKRQELVAEIERFKEEQSISDDNPMLKPALDDDDIMAVVTAWTGIPVTRATEDENIKLLKLDEILGGQVIGQDRAVKAVADVIRRNRMGLSDADKPIGSFLFLGTTGVGKTELCKALADYIFNSRDMIVRIDMSEYQQEHSVSRLFGAPPGYVGYEQGGQLTEAVRRKPYSVVLFDEIEKAHPKVFQTLLQVLDDGRMTDGQGRVVNFKNTIIIMTSNMGYDIILQGAANGPMEGEVLRRTTDAVMEELKHRVAPEFLNRIDEVVMFQPLTRENIRQIVCLQLKSLTKKLRRNDIEITFTDSAIDYLADRGYNPEFGARPVKRTINECVMNELSMKLLSGELTKERLIEVTADLGIGLMFSNTTPKDEGDDTPPPSPAPDPAPNPAPDPVIPDNPSGGTPDGGGNPGGGLGGNPKGGLGGNLGGGLGGNLGGGLGGIKIGNLGGGKDLSGK